MSYSHLYEWVWYHTVKTIDCRQECWHFPLLSARQGSLDRLVLTMLYDDWLVRIHFQVAVVTFKIEGYSPRPLNKLLLASIPCRCWLSIPTIPICSSLSTIFHQRYDCRIENVFHGKIKVFAKFITGKDYGFLFKITFSFLRIVQQQLTPAHTKIKLLVK